MLLLLIAKSSPEASELSPVRIFLEVTIDQHNSKLKQLECPLDLLELLKVYFDVELCLATGSSSLQTEKPTVNSPVGAGTCFFPITGMIRTFLTFGVSAHKLKKIQSQCPNTNPDYVICTVGALGIWLDNNIRAFWSEVVSSSVVIPQCDILAGGISCGWSKGLETIFTNSDIKFIHPH